MTEIPTNQENMERHMKAIESEHILNQISGDVMNTIYSLQTMMSAYGVAGVRIIVTVDKIIAERIEEDE